MPEVSVPPGRPMLSAKAIKLRARLEDSEKPFLPAHNVTVVVARPGEETLACGATLSRLRGARILTVTDGVSHAVNARKLPFSAASRWHELSRALTLAGLKY